MTNNVEWFAELLPNLGVVNIKWKTSTDIPGRLHLRLGSNTATLLWDQGEPVLLPLPAVSAKTMSIDLTAGTLKYPVKPDALSPGVEGAPEPVIPLLAKDVPSNASFTCRGCDTTLAPGPWTRVRDLPSEHWEELLEAWACHDEVYAHDARLHGISALLGMCFLGQSFIQIHPDSLSPKAITRGSVPPPRENIVRPKTATPLFCSACNHLVGEEENGQVRLYKWTIHRVVPSGTFPTEISPLEADWPVYATLDLLSLARVHAAYRIIIRDGPGRPGCMRIWIMNGSTRVSGSRIGPTPIPVARILHDLGPGEWDVREDGVDGCAWTPSQCDEVKSWVLASSCWDPTLPPEQPHPLFAPFTSGFLPLWSPSSNPSPP